MGTAATIAFRYLGSKRRAFISVSTLCAVLGVALGVAALVTVMSVTGGFLSQFREKVLGVNAHVLVMKYAADYPEYETVMRDLAAMEGVEGVAPFSISPMMFAHGTATATGVLLKGVDPERTLGLSRTGDPNGQKAVLDLPRHIVEGSLSRLRSVLRDAPAPTSGVSPTETARPIDALVDDEEPEAAVPSKEPARPEATLEPASGYGSALPDDDVLPAELDVDPCASPSSDVPPIVLGRALARTLNLSVDECVTVTSPTIGFSYSGGKMKAPVARRFRLVAIFEAGFEQYDTKLAYTDILDAQAFYNHGDTATGVEMRVADIDRAATIASQISATLPQGMYHVLDWESLNRGLFTALRIQQVMMSAVLALIILVAAFTVVATLIMVVLEKKKEVCVLKAMGATDGMVLRVFLYQGLGVGLVGTAIGLGLGFAVCKGLLIYGFPLDPKVYFVSKLPVLLRPAEFLVTGGVSLVICVVATLFPSLYAARLIPAEGLRGMG